MSLPLCREERILLSFALFRSWSCLHSEYFGFFPAVAQHWLRKEGRSAPPLPPDVKVTEVIQQNVPVYEEWVAQLNGPVNADITPKVQGYLLSQHYQNGFFVKKGQLLYDIDPGPSSQLSIRPRPRSPSPSRTRDKQKTMSPATHRSPPRTQSLKSSSIPTNRPSLLKSPRSPLPRQRWPRPN